MSLQEIKDHLLTLVGAGELDSAMALLLKELDKNSSVYKLVINLQARLADVRQDIISGAIAADRINESKNNIRTGLLELKDMLHEPDLAGASKPATAARATATIPVFFSRGTPYNDAQKKFMDYFIGRFEQYGLRLETPMWSSENPLLPVREKMKEVYGCIVLALERMQAVESIYKPGSPKEEKFREEFFPTPWVQMEAAMAYQQELPLLIFSEKKLKTEGMIEMGVHEFRIFKVNAEQPEELDEEFYKNLIESWAAKVKKHYQEITNP
ncbi:MAG: hypothetical protein H6577_22060 [Lewinellaceae bacterium]|nr:hypothetical protein [Saprospiraceae bacterium]MCB9340819.1 hypothetical protein [Lewinellaceae bacterium]